jgi:hypothetical protein
MRVLRLGFALSVAAVVSVAMLVPGCSSSPAPSSDTPDAATSPELAGVYLTTSAGPITQLYFIDESHVDVTWAACEDGEPCTSNDTYSLDEAMSQLTLVEPDGKTNVLTLSSLVVDTEDESLHVLGGGAPLTGGGVSLNGDAGTLTGDAATLSHAGIPLVRQVGVALTTGCTQLFKSSGTFPNDKATFDFFRSKGLSAVQAAAIVGNFDQESGNSPTSVQPNGVGHGIGQWSLGARWNVSSNDNVSSYAKSQKLSTTSDQLQLEFTWYELSTFSKYGLASLKKQTIVTEAADVFATDFEACGTCAQTKRDNYANAAYEAFASDPVAGAEAGADGGMCSASSAYGSCTASGKSGTCIGTSTCKSKGGKSTSGLCPGPSSIECCTGETK